MFDGFYRHFQQYFSYNVAVSFIGKRNHRPVASLWQTLSLNVVHLSLIEIRTHNISGDRLWLHVVANPTTLRSRPRRPSRSNLIYHQEIQKGTFFTFQQSNRIGGVMVSMLTSSAVDREFERRSGQTKDFKIGICCFSAKHAALRRKNKDWLARNKNNVSERSDMSIIGLLFQWASTIQFNTTCWSKRTSSSSYWKWTCSRHDIAENLLNWR